MHMKSPRILRAFASIACAALALHAVRAQDMALSSVLIEGEGWQKMAEGYGFADGSCADAEGNFYFTDVSKGTTVNKIDLQGKLSVFIENTPRISGIKFGPDGRLYAATQNPKKQIVAFDRAGQMTVLLDEAEPNDLVVTHQGGVYFTQTGKQQVMYIDPKGAARAVDKGINKPNGLTLSPDQKTLVVSDFGGTNLWTFQIQADGSLAHRQPSMTAQVALGKLESKGDGMTADTAGRYYVCTELGVQMFDPTGRLGGVILKPEDKFAANLAFAGPNHEYLYLACSDKIYRRKTQAKGLLFFRPPAAAGK